ncbi:MAG: 2-hydroxyacyl-CoA dehydratase, partial [Deltaproteobacteria bacterium]|nr:2-hydroxyacyl-CoA dehydratase [Deltaproteobacteria bacterium]
ALAELLRSRGVEVVPFRYPLAVRTRDAARAALEDFASRLGTDLASAAAVQGSLRPLRASLERLERLTWETGQVDGGENHRWLVASSDLGGGDPMTWHDALQAFLVRAETRPPAGPGPRLGLFGVPPALTDLHEAVAAGGARVVFNEVASDFAMLPAALDLEEQVLRYTYPYGIEGRLRRALDEGRRRGVEAWIVYDQAFCHHLLEGPAVDRALAAQPLLHLEGDAPGPLAARDRLRLEAFLRTLSPPRAPRPRRRAPPRSRLGLDLGSRFAKTVLRDRHGGETVRVMDAMAFYRAFARRTPAGLRLDLDAVLREGHGRSGGEPVTGVATGYGRHLEGLVGCRAVPEVHAHAAGARAQAGPGEFVLADLGGQDTKVMHVRDGEVLDFALNDRCAAGSGRYVENMARLLGMPLEEVLRHHRDPVALSNVCATFGESEVVGLVVDGVPPEQICAGILRSVASRLLQLLGRLPRTEPLPLLLSGGLADSPGLVRLLEQGRTAAVAPLPRPQLNGALGCLELAGTARRL